MNLSKEDQWYLFVAVASAGCAWQCGTERFDVGVAMFSVGVLWGLYRYFRFDW
jgi:hypothetical protein